MMQVSIFNVRPIFEKGVWNVIFYDSRYPHTEFGQPISKYHVSTILGTDGYGSGHGGLSLDCGIPEWSISEEDMTTVRNHLQTLEN